MGRLPRLEVALVPVLPGTKMECLHSIPCQRETKQRKIKSEL